MMVWAAPGGDALLLFPTKDSLESADTVASIIVYPEKEEDEKNDLFAKNRGEPRYIRVTGIFRLNKGMSGKPRLNATDVDRLGILEDVQEL
ncbi:hypothetical protein [Pseudoxanthomonas wuyuanensis]